MSAQHHITFNTLESKINHTRSYYWELQVLVVTGRMESDAGTEQDRIIEIGKK
jgi:hypothetical protein